MTRRLTIVFAVLFSVLMITAVPANVSAADEQLVVGSQHTDFGTGNEASPQTLSNLTVSGSGDSASVIIDRSGQTTLPPYPDTFSANDKRGVKFEASKGISGVDITVSEKTSGLTTAYLTETDGTVLDSASLSNGEASLRASLSAGTSYYVTADAGGSSYTRSQNGSASFPYDGGVITVTAGVYSGFRDTTSSYQNIKRIRTANSEPAEKGTYESANHSVSDPAELRANLSVTNATATIAAEYWDGSAWKKDNSTTVSSGGEVSVQLSTSADKWRTVATFANDTANGQPEFSLDNESILFTDQAPVVDAASASPSGGEVVQTQNPTLSINVTDQEFGTAQDETVTATAYDASDDSQIASTTLNANGTASVTWSDPLTGSNSYYWVVEDSYGESTTTQDFDFEVPGTLRVFNESAPNTKIDDTVGLRVRFFATESGTVVERDVTNGTADLTGLPADQPIAITLKDETDGYIYRRITIDSIVEQQDIYLLPTQANSVQVVFELEDPTGQFAPEETRLLVEKPIKKDFDGDGGNETRYQTVSGDLFGSSGQYPAQLLQDERYRLRVLTEGGNERILGSYTAFGPATEPLQIEQIEPKADQDAGEALYGDVEVADGGNTTTATIRYQNLGDESTTVEYRILAGNQTVIGNVTSDADTFAHVYNVSSANATTFTVEYMIQKPTTTEFGQFKLGGIAGVAGRLPIDAQVLSIISWLLILSTMGLVVIVDPKLAPAGGTGMASGLVILGTVAIPAPVLGVAGAVSVLTLVGGGES